MKESGLSPLGRADIVPATPVIAGSLGSWTITYTVGSYGIDEGGTIKIAQRFATDWEAPQFARPEAAGYTTVNTDGAASLNFRFDPKGHVRPWMKWCLVIDVIEGSLAPGDHVTIVLGDKRGGSPGIRSQTFQESRHEFRVFVDPTNACLARSIDAFPVLAIIPGPAAELVCILPSEALAGQPFEVYVKGQDRWMNPTPSPRELVLQWQGSGPASVHGRMLTVEAPGEGYVIASGDSLSCRSNPVIVHDKPPALRHFWGDLHGQTDSTLGVGTETEYFTFARDVSRLDFTSHQANDFQLSDADWNRLKQVISEFHADHEFVVFPGYEWSANTPAGGDRNVFFLDENPPLIRSSHWQVPESPENEQTPAHPADVFFERIRREVGADRVLLGSHAGGRYSDIKRFFDDSLGPLVEVVSCWGIFEWLLWDALESGYLVGVMCNSDGHKGRPGAEGPGAGQFGIAGGLTCVLAESRTRSAIWDALRQRRCYGTSGPRILLDFQIAGAPMGSSIDAAGPVRAVAKVRGTAPIESIALYCGTQPVLTVRPPEFSRCTQSRRIRVSWQGARSRGRSRRAKWDGRLQVSGSRILSAKPFQIDVPTDGIVSQTGDTVAFRSQTTGDCDGIDLFLDRSRTGILTFDSPVGRCSVDLNDMGSGEEARRFEFGGVGLAVKMERYPEKLEKCAMDFENTVSVGRFRQAFWIKVVQEDGHQAWSSPIYLRALG